MTKKYDVGCSQSICIFRSSQFGLDYIIEEVASGLPCSFEGKLQLGR